MVTIDAYVASELVRRRSREVMRQRVESSIGATQSCEDSTKKKVVRQPKLASKTEHFSR